MSTQICIEVDTLGVLKNKRHAFTNSTTFLAELMQNARRAGASWVEFTMDSDGRLTAADNGRGVECFEKMLRLAETGWDEDTQKAETPFGEGFFSAIYAAKAISIASRGKKISFDTDLALQGQPVDVVPDPDGQEAGTKIELSGLNLKVESATGAVQRFAMGFPIEVIFNGVSLKRPHQETEDFVGLDGVGKVRLDSSELDNGNVVLYLQGLPIGGDDFMMVEKCHVVHLDGSLFKARMPDRTCLIDQDEQAVKIRRAIARQIREVIKKDLESCTDPQMQANRMVDLSEAMNLWGALDLLKHFDVLPRCMLKDCVLPEMYDSRWEDYFQRFGSASFVTKQDVESGKVRVVRGGMAIPCGRLRDKGDHFKGVGGSPALMLAYELGWKRLSYWVPDDHWVNEGAIDIDKLKWVIRWEDGKRGTFEGQFVCADIICCKGYSITSGEFVASPSNSLGMLDDKSTSPELEGVIVVGGGNSGAAGLKMLCSFRDENAYLDDKGQAQEEGQLRAYVLSLTGDPTSSMRVLLEESRLETIAGLRGTAHLVKISQGGELGLYDLEPLMCAARELKDEEISAMGTVGEKLKELLLQANT